MAAVPRPTVLISDDEPYMVSSLGRLLDRAGLAFIGDTCSDVVDLALARQPALIILDLRQPIDGRDLLSRLKQDPRTRGIKVVMLSAVDDQYTRHACLQLGAEDYALKPFDLSFIAKVARMAGAPPEPLQI